MPKWVWPDARGWIGLGAFVLTLVVLLMLAYVPGLRNDEFFQTIATVIVANNWISVVSWAYAATKGGGELAERNASIIEKAIPNNGTTTIAKEEEDK